MRKQIIGLLLFLILFTAIAAGQMPDNIDLSADVPADYYIEARLDTSAKILTGNERIRFLNPTDKELSVLVLHLYPNAFMDTTTTMARSGPKMKSSILENPSSIVCDSILVNDLPPDSVIVDETLLYIYLKDRLQPSRKINVSLKFEIKINRAMMRMGYDANGNYMFAHWHPILAGFQKNEPVLFQYSYDGEFFSNFANYDVRLVIPEGFILSSTSSISEPDSIIQGLAYYGLSAKRVIDFAFACGPSWQRESFSVGNVAINILYLPMNENQLPGLKEYISGSLEFLGEILFEYPYRNLNYIDFNPGAGGMELPRMIVMSFNKGQHRKHDIANTVLHETAHQWFYATIATNEYDEPWLDEGISTYLTDRAMKAVIGETNIYDFYGMTISFLDFGALASRITGILDPLATSSDDFYAGHYYYNVYGRAAAVIKTLEGMLGTEDFDRALRDFAGQYKFGHPDSYDLKSSFQQSTGRDLDRFFENYFFGTARVDYEITSLKSDRADNSFLTEVVLRRNYEGILPQRVVVKFKDGTIQSRDWDGAGKYELFKFEHDRPAEWAAIDTSNFYLIDENFANNSLKSEPENGRTFALASVLTMLVQLIMIFIGLL